jgi:hypothetical protein
MSAATAEPVEAVGTKLARLAATANREHHLVIQSGQAMVAHAVAAGEALLEAKRIIDRGEWTRWLKESFEQSPTTANNYMRIARYKDFVLELGPESVAAALRLVQEAGLPRPRDVYNEEVRELALEMRVKGTPQKDIAALLGTSEEQVTYLLNPGSYERHLVRNREARRRLAAEREARRREIHARAVKRAARKAGAAMAELYATSERMQDLLAAAHAETEDREARAALSRAGHHYRLMRDEVVRALGVHDRKKAA